MPAKWFKCSNGEVIEIAQCLAPGGCKLERCATLPFLRLIGFDREWRGITPSTAGNGPRMLYLKESTDYVVSPESRVWAALGTGTHGKLSLHKYTHNVLSEEALSDEAANGISDVLEADEEYPGFYILYDYKTWGSYKLAKAIGLVKTHIPVKDDGGQPVLLKSGPNKGEIKTVIKYVTDPTAIDLFAEELQLNRYRIFFEKCGFPISKIKIQAIPRDGGTYVAEGRGIDKTLYIIDIQRLPDDYVLAFYKTLSDEVSEAFKTGYVRRCNAFESWDGKRCEKYCEVLDACNKMGMRKPGWGMRNDINNSV